MFSTHNVIIISAELIAKQDKETRDNCFKVCKKSRETSYVKAFVSGYPGWHIIASKEGKKLAAAIETTFETTKKTASKDLNVAELFARFQELTAMKRPSNDQKAELHAINATLKNA